MDFVRENIAPLPSNATLIANFGDFHCTPGLLIPAHEYLKDLVPRMTEPGENLATLSFDEMKLDEHCDLDQKIDAMLGPNSYAQQIFIQSLTGPWKLPYFVEFDVSMTKKTLFDIIHGLDEIGVHILFVTSDQGGKNVGLPGELGLTNDKPYFTFTSKNGKIRKIYFGFDWVHLHKSLRLIVVKIKLIQNYFKEALI